MNLAFVQKTINIEQSNWLTNPWVGHFETHMPSQQDSSVSPVD